MTLGDRTVHQIELFLLSVVEEAKPPIEAKLGRPTLKDRIQDEGRRLQDGGAHYKSRSALARAVHSRLEGVALKTIRMHLSGVWVAPK